MKVAMLAPIALSLAPLLVALSHDRPALTFAQLADNASVHQWTIGSSNEPRLRLLYPDSDPRSADYYFKLAEFHAQRTWHYGNAARAFDRKIHDAAPGDRPPLERLRLSQIEQETRWRLETIKAFKAAARFPDHDKAEQILYQFGVFLESVGDRAQAREVFARLIGRYPQAASIPDAYLYLGELAFADGDMVGALALYEKVETFPNARWRSFAAYKKGWCQLNRRHYDEALATFASVVTMCERDTNPDRARRRALAKETKKDIAKVAVYRDWGRPSDARL